MSEVKKKFIPQWKPGTLCWYLREAGWFPVEVPDSFPRWMREDDSKAYLASEAWAIYLETMKHEDARRSAKGTGQEAGDSQEEG